MSYDEEEPVETYNWHKTIIESYKSYMDSARIDPDDIRQAFSRMRLIDPQGYRLFTLAMQDEDSELTELWLNYLQSFMALKE